MLRAWVSYGYDIEVIRCAYELTIEGAKEPSMSYANAIIERWNSENLRTHEQITASIVEFREKKNGVSKPKRDWSPTLGNSFDTDDFFNAALERSFRETESSNENNIADEEPSERKEGSIWDITRKILSVYAPNTKPRPLKRRRRQRRAAKSFMP